jgi:hypothetical protein
MNKTILSAFAAIMVAGVAHSAMDTKTFTFSSLKLDPATGSVAYVVRGELIGVKVDIGGTTTNAIQISEANLGTIFTATNMADGVYYPRALISGDTVAATGVPWTQTWAALGAGTNALVDRIPMAGLVTVRYIQRGLATNNHSVTLIYNK